MHDKVRQVTRHHKSIVSSCSEAKDGIVVTNTEKMLQRRKKYKLIGDLFADTMLADQQSRRQETML